MPEEYIREASVLLTELDARVLSDQRFENATGVPFRLSGGAGVTHTVAVQVATGEIYRNLGALQITNNNAGPATNADASFTVNYPLQEHSLYKATARFMFEDVTNFVNLAFGIDFGIKGGRHVDYRIRYNWSGNTLDVLGAAGAWSAIAAITEFPTATRWETLSFIIDTQAQQIRDVFVAGDSYLAQNLTPYDVGAYAAGSPSRYQLSYQFNVTAASGVNEFHLDRLALEKVI